MKGFSAADLAEYRRRFPHLFPEGEAAPPEAKANKYGAKREVYNGVVYASKLEAACAAQLDKLMALGFVRSWAGQVPYDLAPGIKYVADFVVDYAEGQPRVIDAKGQELQVFKIKRKLFELKFGPLDVVKHWQEMPVEGREP